jgi:exopolysaccharide biosynthesis operon protein EpsL
MSESREMKMALIIGTSTRISREMVVSRAVAWGLLAFYSQTASAIGDYRDTLEKSVSGQDEPVTADRDAWSVYVGDQLTYDTNLYRLPTNVDLTTLVGPNASREDHINTTSAGLDGQWTIGRQIVDLDLRADDNRFARNSDLNNVSGNDKLVWSWRVGSQLAGQVGTYYYRSLASFVNTTTYTRNLINSTAYYGTARYQVGPHWALYAGVLESQIDLTAVASKSNDNQSKIVHLGTELATRIGSSIGWEYRFTDVTFPHSVVANGLDSTTNYREDLGRFLFKYAISDKSSIDANAGYLKRDYVSTLIPSFSGDVWHVSFQWQPTGKTQLLVEGWRKLQAYLTAQTEYFVSKGVSLSPVWRPSEKLGFSFVFLWEDQNYAGSRSNPPGTENRHDSVSAGQVGVVYSPIKAITVNLSYRHELRNSNEAQFKYYDNLALAGITFRY